MILDALLAALAPAGGVPNGHSRVERPHGGHSPQLLDQYGRLLQFHGTNQTAELVTGWSQCGQCK